MPGIGLQITGIALGSDTGAQAIAAPIMLIGTALLFVGLGYYAAAKGQSPVWCLMGFLSIIGLIVLACLPDRAKGPLPPQPDIDQSPAVTGTRYVCIRCGYTLHAITSTVCPECGTPFDPRRPETMRLALAVGDQVRVNAPWTATWSLICGILTLVLTLCMTIQILPAGFAIGFGHHALVVTRGKPYWRRARIMAIVGLVMGYIGLAVFVLVIAMITVHAIYTP